MLKPFREGKPGRFAIINFDYKLEKGFRRGVVCVFDVKLVGLGVTVCNLTLEHNRRHELVLGYPRSSIRKRLPKTRHELRVAITPEMEQEIYTKANHMIPAASRGQVAVDPEFPNGLDPEDRDVR